MTDRELMQMALVALDSKHDMTKAEWRVLQYHAFTALRARLAQPDLITPADVKQLARIEKLVEDVDPYTAPPQREWQGLTENEIKHLWYEACQTNLELTSQLIVHLARNIEAKLKERNT